MLLSNSLVSLNSANNNVDKCNKDFDPHENGKKECVFTCYCGRGFKTLLGLNVHKRSCHIFDVSEISDLLKETVEETGNESDVVIDTETLLKSLLKPGVKLPKSDKEWERANDFFRHNLIGDPENPDINIEIANFQSLLYEFFSNSYGTVNDTNREFDQKYTNSTKNELKKTLKQLKLINTPPLQEIRFVSRLLRNRYRKKESESFDHQLLYKSNFWKYCHKIFQPAENRVKPNFSKKDCYKYFKKTLSEKNQFRDYNTPSWMQKLNEPTIDFNLEAPTYREITKIIFKMKSSSSPCPFDQVSIIVLKKCPFLRTYLWRIISASWSRGDFPTVWKQGITVLAYKKGSNEDPANFRPITLQPVLSKVFTSILRNRIHDFCYKNKFIESNLQKGFWDNISGCVEHTKTLTHIINDARKKQKSLIIALLDLILRLER